MTQLKILDLKILDLERKLKTDMSSFTSKDLEKIKLVLDNRYYNTAQETVSDFAYDLLVDELKRRGVELNTIGCVLKNGTNAVKLPFTLNSMDKIKHEEGKKLAKWVETRGVEFVVSDKLNGVSCLVCFDANGKVKMYSRGDGITGSDVSYFSDKIRGIPKLTNISIRGELIIKSSVFTEKYSSKFKNSLGLIVGVVNSKTLKKAIEDIEFVAYEIVSSRSDFQPSKNLELLKQLGCTVVFHTILKSADVTADKLAAHLQSRGEWSPFSIDGLIVQVNKPYDRTNVEASGNPSYAIAFKIVVEEAETVVEEVEWNISRHSTFFPRVRFTPVHLAGAEIQWASGGSAKFIVDNKINVGSRIVVIRAGEIIPKIHRVLSFSKTPALPTVPFVWNKTGVDLMLSREASRSVGSPAVDKTVLVQKITHFFVTLKTKQVAEKTIQKLVDAGHDTVFKILDLTIEDLCKIPTFEARSSERIYNNIQEALSKHPITTGDLMVASCCFGEGLGIKRFTTLLEHIPEFETASVEAIVKIPGFNEVTALKIINGMASFVVFYNKLKPYLPLSQDVEETPFTADEIKQLKGAKQPVTCTGVYVFTNFRDKVIEAKIREMGGEVADSVTKKTTVVVTPDGFEGPSAKVAKAKQYGITVVEKSKLVLGLTYIV